MARVYTTRQLLDPNMISILNKQAANKLQFETEQNKAKYDAIRKALGTAGSVGQNIYEQSKRASEMEDEWSISPEVLNDPVYKAAREEYIRTGSSGPLQQYILQKQTADARKEESKLRSEQAAKDKAWHDAVRLAQARPEYSKVQKAMFDAIDAGDYETADIMKKQLQAYETEFGSEAFGGSAESMAEARKKSAKAATQKAAREKADQEELEMGERNLKAIQEVNENERLHKVALFKNTLPTTFKTEAEKQKVYDLIEKNEDMTLVEKTKLLDEIRSVESGATAKKKSIQSATATKAGEATGKSIDEATNKNKAATYIGQKMNSLNFEDIPDEVRAYLKMDSKGIVGWK